VRLIDNYNIALAGGFVGYKRWQVREEEVSERERQNNRDGERESVCVCWRVYAQSLAHGNTCHEIFGLTVDPCHALGIGVHSERNVLQVFALMW